MRRLATHQLLAVALLLAAVSTGCGQHRVTRPAAADAETRSLAEDRALALAAPGGTQATRAILAGLQAAARRDGAGAEAWTSLAHGWIRAARETADPALWLDVAASARIARRKDPSSVAALDLLAQVMLQAHRFGEARAAAHQVLAEHAEDLDALSVLADAALELGDFDAAIDATQAMADLRPGLASYGRAAWLAWLQGDTAGAHELYRLAMEAGDPAKDPEPVAWLMVQDGLLSLHHGDADRAASRMASALALVDGYPPALVGTGRVALAQGRPAEAATALERAFVVAPLASTAWLMADARRAGGDEAGARAAEARVLSLAATDRRTLAAFLANRNLDAARALALVDEESKDRGGPETDDVRAWALYRLGRFAEAREASDRARRLGTRDPLLDYHAGAIRISQGHVDEGRALVREALAHEPLFDARGAAEAARLLQDDHVAHR